jgi:hypothetical protein
MIVVVLKKNLGVSLKQYTKDAKRSWQLGTYNFLVWHKHFANVPKFCLGMSAMNKNAIMPFLFLLT